MNKIGEMGRNGTERNKISVFLKSDEFYEILFKYFLIEIVFNLLKLTLTMLERYFLYRLFSEWDEYHKISFKYCLMNGIKIFYMASLNLNDAWMILLV